MGSLDKVTGSVVVRHSKIIDLTGMTRPQTKVALDEFLNVGWILVSIYRAGTDIRAVMIRTEE